MVSRDSTTDITNYNNNIIIIVELLSYSYVILIGVHACDAWSNALQ